MHDRFVVPESALPYILFQRTTYLRFPVASVYRLFNNVLPFQTPLYNLVVAIEARIGKGRIKALYQADIEQEFQELRSQLPNPCHTVLDIGCGVAGIDVLIQSHHYAQPLEFYLLDRSYVEKRVYYLYHTQAAFYNSLDVAKELLVCNGIEPDHVHLIEVNEHNDIPVDTSFDMILSLLSWGFHFPVATYLERAHELLRPGGVLILDVRKGTNGMNVLRQVFHSLGIINETPKSFRVVATK